MIGRRATLAVAAACLTAYLGGGGVQTSLALFTSRETVRPSISTAASFRTWYLHNNPTPPAGDTQMQAVLPLTRRPPVATVLYNYDTDNDAAPGRLLIRGGGGQGISDPKRTQAWRTPPFALATPVNGTVRLTIWTAMKGFVGGQAGSIIAYLRERNPGTGNVTSLASGSLYLPDWMAGSTTWVPVEISFPVANHTIAIGRELEVRVQIAPAPPPDDDMWLAYDTVAYPSKLVLP